jgi:hypothetical protein
MQRPLDGIGPILTEYTQFAQLGSGLKNAPLYVRFNAIPGATALGIGKRTPIQTLASAMGNPTRHHAHADAELPSYFTQTNTRSDSADHLTTLAFNGAFLAMLNSPQNPLPYPKCSANAEPQVFC